MNLKSLIPWSRSSAPTPFGPMFNLQDDINRMFDDMWRRFDAPLNVRAGAPAAWATWPAVEVHELDKAVEVSFELPGMAEKDVELSIESDVLTVKGEKREEKADKKTGYSERTYGSFERSVALPPGLIADKADASFKDGVLTVKIPKSEDAQPKSKRIHIAKA